MSVLVRIGRKKAILCAGKWICADLRIEDRLQALLDVWIAETGGPPIGHGDPDGFAADAMQNRIGYEIAISSRPRGRIAHHAYLMRRQIRLPF